jgi:hypothetical protein
MDNGWMAGGKDGKVPAGSRYRTRLDIDLEEA